jgi:MarR family transcriptional regulator, lower aerobic nicotinate degradation pathway regulator
MRPTARVTDRAGEAEEHVGFLLRLAYQRASANLTAAIGESGLTPMQFQTLRRLLQRGQMTQNELGRSVGMPPANIHSTVRRLRASELVAIQPSPKDKRLALVELTSRGEEMLRRVIPAADAANAQTVSVLTQGEQEALMDSLCKVAAGSRTVATS